jgi:hypothetical protein
MVEEGTEKRLARQCPDAAGRGSGTRAFAPTGDLEEGGGKRERHEKKAGFSADLGYPQEKGMILGPFWEI